MRCVSVRERTGPRSACSSAPCSTTAARSSADATRRASAKRAALMPPGPLARSASKNLALFSEGELFNLAAIPGVRDHEVTAAFSISRSSS